MDQKAYLLERYASLKALEVHKKTKTKRKKAKAGNSSKRPRTSQGGINIVDADAQWKPADSDEDEDAPALVEDAEVKRMMLKEEMRQQPFRSASSKDGGGWVEVTADPKTSGSDRTGQDVSPVRQSRVRHDSPDLSPPRGKRQESEDLSPPRQGGTRHDSPDLSPPRQGRTGHDSPSPPRQGRTHQASPDLSPPRQGRTRHDSPDLSPPRQGRIRHDSPDLSPPRQGRATDMAPPRARPDSADLSPPRQGRARQASPDLSPPRARQQPLSRGRNNSQDLSPTTPPRQASLSPSRRARTKDSSPPRRGRHDSDLSPPRRARAKKDSSPPRRARTKESDSPPRRAKGRNGSPDFSPPRRGRHDSPDLFPARGKQESEDLSPPRRGKPSSDLSPPRQPRGSQALPPLPPRRGGLQTAAELKDELSRQKEREADRLKELDPSVTGRGAQTVYRKDGKKAAKLEEQAPKPPEKPLEWGKGLVQKRAAEAKQEELEREMQKPFARSKDDPDLDKYLRKRIHWGDPMAHLVKRDDEMLLEDLGQSEAMKESGFLVPQKIPDHSWLKRRLPAAPNRFDIKPGRHWDGIDRSNGFEQNLFKKQNEKKAQQEYAYRWSVEDM